MKNFKKLLGLIGFLGVSISTTLSTVACGKQVQEKVYRWDLDAYNNKIEGKSNKIWISRKDFQKATSDNKVSDYLKLALWTGMFDTDDKDGNHERQIKRFNNQNISKKLLIDNLDIVRFSNLIARYADDIENVNLELTANVKSMTTDTDKQNIVKEFTLLKSKTSISKIKINYTDLEDITPDNVVSEITKLSDANKLVFKLEKGIERSLVPKVFLEQLIKIFKENGFIFAQKYFTYISLSSTPKQEILNKDGVWKTGNDENREVLFYIQPWDTTKDYIKVWIKYEFHIGNPKLSIK